MQHPFATVPFAAKLGFSAAVFGVLAAAPALAAFHPGDKIDVFVYNHPELSTPASAPVVVDASGDVTVPVAGVVRAQGLGAAQLAAAITRRLKPYIREPAVQVSLEQQSEAIFVSGGPGGVLAYKPGETLTSVVDQIQTPSTERGATQQAIGNAYDTTATTARNAPADLTDGPVDYKAVRVLRDGRELGPFDVTALRDAGSPGLVLVPDDTIQLVNKPVAVKVVGAVVKPGTAYLYATDPLQRAIDQVGGPLPAASSDIAVARDGSTQIVPLGAPVFASPAVGGDVVDVPRAPRVDVLGVVTHPGETLLKGNQTLISAIYYAGGPDKYANLTAVQVTHAGVQTQYNLKKVNNGARGDNPQLADGDVVFVPLGSTFDANIIFGGLLSLLYRI